MTKEKLAVIYALSAVLLWSTVATAFKIALTFVNFAQLLFFASAVSVLTYFVFALFEGKTAQLFRASPRAWFTAARNGFLNPFLYYMILLKAYSILPAQLAQPLNYLWPIVLVLLSAPMLKEKLSARSVVALLFGFAGVYVIATRGEIFSLNIENPTGVALAAGSSVVWALSWIFNKKDSADETVKLFRNFLFGFFYTTVYLLFTNDFVIPKFNGFLAVIYVGLFETGITFLLWMRALQLATRSDNISNLVFLSPFLALIFIHFILGEHIYYTTPIGSVLILTGVFFNRQKSRKNKI